ncbi:hypothetical protein [Zobellia roscoffensis]|uniref:hypothetical protein n=1 Tax=Zobellia roscoffensis TaxID=2779508 RepID=UPI00188CCCFA|nr:hypothetical protein [Zobellia roscoffensis]
MYQNVFSIDETYYKSRIENGEPLPEYQLNNYDYYLPRLEEDIYLRIFLKKLLFDIDILQVSEYLDFHYENSQRNNKLIQIIELKVLPAVDNIIANSSINLNGGYPSQRKLEDGFVDIEGTFKNDQYEFSTFYHITGFKKLSEGLTKRKLIIFDWLKTFSIQNEPLKFTPIKWCGKPSHIGIVVNELIQQGYIEAPLNSNDEINYSELSRTILKMFSFDKPSSVETLRRYLNPDDNKHIPVKENFDNQGFNIPHSGLTS